MRFLINCNMGFESLVKKEISIHGGTIAKVKDKLVYFDGDEQLLTDININSRFGNKVFILLGEKNNVTDFQGLFDLVYGIDRGKYIGTGQRIVVLADSIKSKLTSTPTIQSIGKKAIVKKLLGSDEGFLDEDVGRGTIEINIVLDGDVGYVLLNTTGRALHNRGYRKYSNDAPLKENMAAGIVQMANWKYSDVFGDFFCGSGTIVIEAAMIAKNIAPGLNRDFAFEQFQWLDTKFLKNSIEKAKAKEFHDKEHTIIASDISGDCIDMAIANAKLAGVDKYIKFEVKKFEDQFVKNLWKACIVSNPPYGLRLQVDDIDRLYRNIVRFYEENENIYGGIFTGYEKFALLSDNRLWKNTKLYNGGEKCYFYKFL